MHVARWNSLAQIKCLQGQQQSLDSACPLATARGWYLSCCRYSQAEVQGLRTWGWWLQEQQATVAPEAMPVVALYPA